MAETPGEDDFPPHLASLSEKEKKGLRERAEREGVPVGQLKLRESLRPGMPVLTAKQKVRKDLRGILARMKRARKSLQELPLRATDDPWVLADAMAEICIRAGLPFKSAGGGRTTGRLTEKDLEILDGQGKDGQRGQNK